MAERLRRLLRLAGALLRAVGRFLFSLLGRVGRWFSRCWRLFEIDRAVRALERERRQVFENAGRMVFLLHKRNLVRNADLLAECEKVRDIDAAIDGLLEKADGIRVAPRPAAGGELETRVAATPLEFEPPAASAETTESVEATS